MIKIILILVLNLSIYLLHAKSSELEKCSGKIHQENLV